MRARRRLERDTDVSWHRPFLAPTQSSASAERLPLQAEFSPRDARSPASRHRRRVAGILHGAAAKNCCHRVPAAANRSVAPRCAQIWSGDRRRVAKILHCAAAGHCCRRAPAATNKDLATRWSQIWSAAATSRRRSCIAPRHGFAGAPCLRLQTEVIPQCILSQNSHGSFQDLPGKQFLKAGRVNCVVRFSQRCNEPPNIPHPGIRLVARTNLYNFIGNWPCGLARFFYQRPSTKKVTLLLILATSGQ